MGVQRRQGPFPLAQRPIATHHNPDAASTLGRFFPAPMDCRLVARTERLLRKPPRATGSNRPILSCCYPALDALFLTLPRFANSSTSPSGTRNSPPGIRQAFGNSARCSRTYLALQSSLVPTAARLRCFAAGTEKTAPASVSTRMASRTVMFWWSDISRNAKTGRH